MCNPWVFVDGSSLHMHIFIVPNSLWDSSKQPFRSCKKRQQPTKGPYEIVTAFHGLYLFLCHDQGKAYWFYMHSSTVIPADRDHESRQSVCAIGQRNAHIGSEQDTQLIQANMRCNVGDSAFFCGLLMLGRW